MCVPLDFFFVSRRTGIATAMLLLREPSFYGMAKYSPTGQLDATDVITTQTHIGKHLELVLPLASATSILV